MNFPSWKTRARAMAPEPGVGGIRITIPSQQSKRHCHDHMGGSHRVMILLVISVTSCPWLSLAVSDYYHRLPLCAPLPRPLDGRAADFLGAVVEVEPPAVCHLIGKRGSGARCPRSVHHLSSSSSPTQSLQKFKLTDAENLLGLGTSSIVS